MTEITESHDPTPTDTAMDDGIQSQLPILHNDPRIHLERLAVFLAFREGFAQASKATRMSFHGTKKKFVERRREFFEQLISKPEVSLQLHRMKKKSIIAAAEYLFKTARLFPNSTMNKHFAHLSAEQIKSAEWRASVSLPPLKKRIVVMVEFEPVSRRTRSNCERCQNSKIAGDESQLSAEMEKMCLCAGGHTSTLNGGNSGADLAGNDDEEMEMN
ncbi:uncharacterized protein EAF01_009287 [Botrytis porri]|uniref:Uncharacterized protein n=1 Tax=Botrytis porri TaxID=87229 RepID=A0A4Z1KJ21_9HELO|nr:uncharacterized protein EAF01_009287 [Botrytis porri]KAF7896884.1 hypothetical protein EAF01_009287 [Botrytis porri]TGO84252.1 hypothetical protein BPOR_0528g00030 [Botrytis porri]